MASGNGDSGSGGPDAHLVKVGWCEMAKTDLEAQQGQVDWPSDGKG